MILHEALVITTVAGSLGLVAGFGVIKLIRLSGLETEYFRDPQVDLPVAGGAFLVLVVAGIVAGLLPALQAVKIQPIEALRHE